MLLVQPNPDLVINASGAAPGGSMSYMSNFLRALDDVDDEDLKKLVVLTAPWNHKILSNEWAGQTVQLPVKTPAQRFVYEQAVLPLRFSRSRLLHVANFAPIGIGGSRSTVIIHNSNYFGKGLVENRNPSARLRFEGWMCAAGIKRAARVVAISDSLSDEILETVEISASKMTTVHSGMNQFPSAQAPEFKPDGKYILSLANGYAHKRLEVLAKEWANSGTHLDLVFVGQIDDSELLEDLRKSALAAIGKMVLVGPISNRAQVRWYLENCAALVSSSVLEAHPLTPAEAGQFGRVLILSDIAPHREICGARAHYFDPSAPGQLAKLLCELEATRLEAERWEWPVDWSSSAHQIIKVALSG